MSEVYLANFMSLHVYIKRKIYWEVYKLSMGAVNRKEIYWTISNFAFMIPLAQRNTILFPGLLLWEMHIHFNLVPFSSVINIHGEKMVIW